MKYIKYLLFSLVIASIAHGQAQPIRNDTPSNLRDLGSNLSVGKNFSVDQKGQLLVGNTAPGTGATSLGKAEDAAHTTGDTGVACWAVRTDTAAASGANGDYVTINTDSLGKLWIAGNQLEDVAHTTADIGDFILSVRTDTAASSANTTGDYAALNSDSLGALYVHEIGGATNGLSVSSVISAATNNSTSLKGSAAQVYSIHVCNTTAATVRFVKLYSKATAPTCGTDTPSYRIVAAANNCTEIGIPAGLAFASGLGLCIVGAAADNDNTSVAAADVYVNIGWK